MRKQNKITKLACFDLKGTLVNHRNLTSQIPLMDQLMKGLERAGWTLYLLSTYRPQDARRILNAAGVATRLNIFDLAGEDKGVALSKILQKTRAKKVLYIDDKPANLADVKRLHDDRVRIIGFVGSMKYAAGEFGIASWCTRNRVELALSSVDLCETLRIWISDRHVDSLSADELVMLIPGLDHPRSAIAGETANFDHRCVIAKLLRRDIAGYEDTILKKMAWITCHECLLKAVVEVAILAAHLDRHVILGNAYKAHEYESMIRANRDNRALRDMLIRALNCLQDGIAEIGRDAERCRPMGRNIDLDRIKYVSNAIFAALR